jgi:RHS repeat-associated protein
MSGPDQEVTLGFTGQNEDTEVGLVNLSHRLYDPRSGRFTSADPLVKDLLDGQSFNRYAYAGNNPLSFVDPTGLQDEPSPDVPDDGVLEQDGLGDGNDLGNWIEIDSRISSDGLGNYVIWTTSCEIASCQGLARPLDPTTPQAPFESLQSAESLPAVPAMVAPPSASQDSVNRTTGAAGPGGNATLAAVSPIIGFAPNLSLATVPGGFNGAMHPAAVTPWNRGDTLSILTCGGVLALVFGYPHLVAFTAMHPEAINLVNEIARSPTAPSPVASPATAALPAMNGMAPWAGRIVAGETTEAMTLYHVWGGDTLQAGEWLATELPTSRAEARAGYSLPPENTAEFVSKVTVPAGTQVQVSVAARLFGQPGGKVQVQLLQQIPRSNFGPGVPLPQ